jgi:hypothetical protein
MWSMVAAQYWGQYDSNIHFFTDSKQMGEGVNVIQGVTIYCEK